AFDAGRFGETLHMERNFFGVVRVTRSPDGRFIQLVHGTSIHGQQRISDAGRPRPMAYYYERGPVGHLFDNLSFEQRRVKLERVGVVGLGTGAISYYAKPGQNWTFFEIDPAIKRIAESGEYFGFLKNCQAESCDVILGDARRQLARANDGTFDHLILDGFCSDAIPVHLLTREAIALYVRKLKPGGILAIHVTNPHLDLAPLVTRLAADHDPPLAVRYRNDIPSDEMRAEGKTSSEWMILGRNDDALGPVSWDPYWDPVKPVPGPVWRDDFANVLAAWRTHEQD
ncbi:MAG TPA: fused MFS/spermidine synthase, partial [Gemmata sp.]|nr:fused MFS/spermidine synthase [Gemmata sp.]